MGLAYLIGRLVGGLLPKRLHPVPVSLHPQREPRAPQPADAGGTDWQRDASDARVPVAVVESLASFVKVINESLQLARTSTVPATKASRLIVANARLRDLKALVAQYPRLRITSLVEVEKSIAELDAEFVDLGHYEPEPPSAPRLRLPG